MRAALYCFARNGHLARHALDMDSVGPDAFIPTKTGEFSYRPDVALQASV